MPPSNELLHDFLSCEAAQFWFRMAPNGVGMASPPAGDAGGPRAAAEAVDRGPPQATRGGGGRPRQAGAPSRCSPSPLFMKVCLCVLSVPSGLVFRGSDEQAAFFTQKTGGCRVQGQLPRPHVGGACLRPGYGFRCEPPKIVWEMLCMARFFGGKCPPPPERGLRWAG